MGITDFFGDMLSSLSFTEAHAEAPAEDKEDENQEEGGEEKEEDDSKEEEPEEEEGGEEEDEEEEEEEEEPEDLKPKLEEECAHSAKCAPYLHHYEECVERVTAAQDDSEHPGAKEDCVEEFFHLTHCATQCAAPKLWKVLK